jgi:hypothetical protein
LRVVAERHHSADHAAGQFLGLHMVGQRGACPPEQRLYRGQIHALVTGDDGQHVTHLLPAEPDPDDEALGRQRHVVTPERAGQVGAPFGIVINQTVARPGQVQVSDQAPVRVIGLPRHGRGGQFIAHRQLLLRHNDPVIHSRSGLSAIGSDRYPVAVRSRAGGSRPTGDQSRLPSARSTSGTKYDKEVI